MTQSVEKSLKPYFIVCVVKPKPESGPGKAPVKPPELKAYAFTDEWPESVLLSSAAYYGEVESYLRVNTDEVKSPAAAITYAENHRQDFRAPAPEM